MAVRKQKRKYATVAERRRAHHQKHTLLRRLCYKFVRDTMPTVWEEMKVEVGLLPRKKKGKK